ncbi:MAG TPA: CocE/NonD family hydrolase [Mycobacteriales bacterium]|nr:CocE/NonD family hydrolase [Mycobacteriales bacterium]
MTIASRLLARAAKLPAATHKRIGIERDVPIPMSDGVVLLATRLFPRDEPTAPVVLMRSPYGRTGLLVASARVWAERGYQVIIQSVRGTFGSGGQFVPFRNEHSDGHDTLDWIREQAWAGDKLATIGPSYLGHTQWAIADTGPGVIDAMSITVSSTDFRRSVIYPWSLFAMDTALSWTALIHTQEKGLLRSLVRLVTLQPTLDRAFAVDPREADEIVVGHPVEYYRDWIDHESDDDWWQVIDHRLAGVSLAAPIDLVGGWHDLFLPAQITDFLARQAAGRETRLAIGPWKHTSSGMASVATRRAFDLFEHRLKGKPHVGAGDPPVTMLLGGADVTLHADTWPPKSVTEEWHLGTARSLDRVPSSEPGYDVTPIPLKAPPLDGGVSLNFKQSGQKKNTAREASDGVISFTGPVLESDVAVVGDITVDLYVDGDLDELAVRICDVDAKGISRNISDSVRVMQPATEPQLVSFELWPTGQVFKAGHRLRLQVASGLRPSVVPVKPRVAPSPGRMLRVWHGGDTPSALYLPVVELP